MENQLPVVLVHSARVSRTMWRPQLEALHRSGREAFAVDLPGHGQRTRERFTIDGSIATIDEAVMRAGGRAVVTGVSLGGYLGIAYTGRHPERVAGLLVSSCSTVTDRSVTDAWLLLTRLIARLPDQGAWLNQRAVNLSLPPQGARDAGAGGFALDVMVDMLTAMRHVDPLADLRRATCPVWIVNGQWDHFRVQERTFARVPRDGRLMRVRGATHLVNLARPVVYSRVLLEALEEVDAREAGPTPSG